MNIVVLRGQVATPMQVLEHVGGVRFVGFDLSVINDDALVDVAPITWLQTRESGHRPFSLWKPGDDLVIVGTVSRRFSRNNEITVGRTEVAAAFVGKVTQKGLAAPLDGAFEEVISSLRALLPER